MTELHHNLQLGRDVTEEYHGNIGNHTTDAQECVRKSFQNNWSSTEMLFLNVKRFSLVFWSQMIYSAEIKRQVWSQTMAHQSADNCTRHSVKHRLEHQCTAYHVMCRYISPIIIPISTFSIFTEQRIQQPCGNGQIFHDASFMTLGMQFTSISQYVSPEK